MPEEENYHIRRDEWQEVRDTVKRIEEAVVRFLEREKASDAKIDRAQLTADEAIKVAYEAKNEAGEAKRMVTDTGRDIDRWQDWAFKIAGSLVVLGIAGVIGFMVGS